MTLRRQTILNPPLNRQVLPTFPKVPDAIKNSRSDLRKAWSDFETALEAWRQSAQMVLQRDPAVANSLDAQATNITTLQTQLNALQAELVRLSAQITNNAEIQAIKNSLSILQQQFNMLIQGRYFTYTQHVPAYTWVVYHGLGRKPSVTVLDPDGQRMFGDEQHISDTELHLTFAAAVTGSVECS